MDGGAGLNCSCDYLWLYDSVKGHHFDRLRAVQVVWAGLRFCTANVLLQSQQTVSADTQTPLYLHIPLMIVNLLIWGTDNQEKHQPTRCVVSSLPSHLSLCLFSFSFLDSFIATIPFLSLTASLICPCVYNGNLLPGSTETESSEWEWESGQSARGRSPRFMEGHSGAHLTIWPERWSNRWRCALIVCLGVFSPTNVLQQVLKLCKHHKRGVHLPPRCNCSTFDPDLLSHLSLVTAGHGGGGGHLSHAWKVTPGASVGFQTRPTKWEAEAMYRCCQGSEWDIGEKHRERQWMRVTERDWKEKRQRQRNASFINTPAAAMHAGHECVSPESSRPHHYLQPTNPNTEGTLHFWDHDGFWH